MLVGTTSSLGDGAELCANAGVDRQHRNRTHRKAYFAFECVDIGVGNVAQFIDYAERGQVAYCVRELFAFSALPTN